MTESNIVIYQSLVNSEVHSTNDDALLSLRTEDLIEVDPTKPDDIGCSRDSFTNTGYLFGLNKRTEEYGYFPVKNCVKEIQKSNSINMKMKKKFYVVLRGSDPDPKEKVENVLTRNSHSLLLLVDSSDAFLCDLGILFPALQPSDHEEMCRQLELDVQKSSGLLSSFKKHCRPSVDHLFNLNGYIMPIKVSIKNKETYEKIHAFLQEELTSESSQQQATTTKKRKHKAFVNLQQRHQIKLIQILSYNQIKNRTLVSEGGISDQYLLMFFFCHTFTGLVNLHYLFVTQNIKRFLLGTFSTIQTSSHDTTDNNQLKNDLLFHWDFKDILNLTRFVRHLTNFFNVHSSCKEHDLVDAYLTKPLLCTFCDEYVWNKEMEAMRCSVCGKTFHVNCCLQINFLNDPCSSLSSPPPSSSSSSSFSSTSTKETAFVQFLLTHNYLPILAELILKLPSSLELIGDMKIQTLCNDKKILKTLELILNKKLTSNDEMLKEQENLRGPLLWPDRNPLVMVLEPFSKHSSSQTLDPKSHNFVTCSFSSSQLCHVCWHPYRGVIHQGLQCDVCGLCCHKNCASGTLPACDITDLKGNLERHECSLSRPLSEQFKIGEKAPKSVLMLVEELEKRQNNNGSDLHSAHVSHSSFLPPQLMALKHALQKDEPLPHPLSHYQDLHLCGVLRRILFELPNPLIPTEFYPVFINAAKISDDTLCQQVLGQLVNKLPHHHKATLLFLVNHLRRVYQQENKENNDVNKLSHVFCHVVMKPPWESIEDLVANTPHHIRMLNLLVTSRENDKDDVADAYLNLNSVLPLKMKTKPIPIKLCDSASNTKINNNNNIINNFNKLTMRPDLLPHSPKEIKKYKGSDNNNNNNNIVDNEYMLQEHQTLFEFESAFKSPDSIKEGKHSNDDENNNKKDRIEEKIFGCLKKTEKNDEDEEEEEDLEKYEWYWGEICREKTNEVINDHPDGTFLIRDSSKKHPNPHHTNYILSLRANGLNKHIKICHKDNKYGFIEPLTFPSICSLIEYHQEHSLSQYNPSLNVKLTNPLANPNKGYPDNQASVEDVRTILIQTHSESLHKYKIFEQMQQQYTTYLHLYKMKRLSLDAFRETLVLLEDQSLLHKSLFSGTFSPKVKENLEILELRKTMLEKNYKDLKGEIDDLIQVQTQLCTLIKTSEVELQELNNKRNTLKKWLCRHNHSEQSLDALLESITPTSFSSFPTFSSSLPPHINSHASKQALTRRSSHQTASLTTSVTLEPLSTSLTSSPFVKKMEDFSAFRKKSADFNTCNHPSQLPPTPTGNISLNASILKKKFFSENTSAHNVAHKLPPNRERISSSPSQENSINHCHHHSSTGHSVHFEDETLPKDSQETSGWKTTTKPFQAIFDSSLWYVNCTFQQAEGQLKNRPTGTFLIRPSSVGGHALSVVVNGSVKHCKIHQCDGHYSFTDSKSHSHHDLSHLVNHHNLHSLQIYNPELTTCLLYPVNQ